MITNRRLIFLFDRYANNSCTEAEKLEFLYCVANSAHHRQLKSLMDGLWAGLPEEKKLSATQAQRILNTILASGKNEKIQRRPQYFRWRAGAAAAVLLVVLGIGAAYFLMKPGAVQPVVPFAGKKESITPYKTIVLPDGSTVVLNHSSELQYATTFDGLATREVYLKGEGFFDVKHDASKPFIVHTGTLKTTVLGTAFNIKAYQGEKRITVTVTRGKVKVGDGDKTLGVITHNEQITFYPASNEAARKEVNASKVIAWQEGNIYFDDITIEAAVQQLEERFGVNIAWSTEKLKDCRFTASFIMGESLEEIIQVICEFNQSTYKKHADGNFTIEGAGC